MDHINLQLLTAKVILALELTFLEPVGDDPTWSDTSGIPIYISQCFPKWHSHLLYIIVQIKFRF